jgi:hypothetical protein
MKTKECTKCKVEKSLNDFHKHTKGNYQSWCKQCQKDWLNAYWKSPEGKAYSKQYREENREMFRKSARKWQKNNPEKSKQFVYDWYKEKTKEFVAIQDKYQSKIPPSVYCIKYDDEVIYVGKARKPLMRCNVHLSTIKTGTNLTKVNKLHSYCGFDKSRFSYEYLEQGEYDTLLEREAYWEEYYDAKGNYKRIFGKVKSINQIMKELGIETNYQKYYKKKGGC